MEKDTAYFGRRAAEERSAAMHAADLRAREAHLEMAERYDELASAIASNEERLGLNAAANA